MNSITLDILQKSNKRLAARIILAAKSISLGHTLSLQ